jgi:hypothetical protein
MLRSGNTPILNKTPPWERVWESGYTFFPRIRLADDDGTVWEVALNPYAVESVILAPRSPGQAVLNERVERLIGGDYRSRTNVNLLNFVRGAQVQIRGFVPDTVSALDYATWADNLGDFVHFDFTEPFIRGPGDSITKEYEFGDSILAVVHEIKGTWVDYVVNVAHQMYIVPGHNPPGDDCIKLADCTLFCDRGKKN